MKTLYATLVDIVDQHITLDPDFTTPILPITVHTRADDDVRYQCPCGVSLWSRGMVIHLSNHVKQYDMILSTRQGEIMIDPLTYRYLYGPTFQSGDTYFSFLIRVADGDEVANHYLLSSQQKEQNRSMHRSRVRRENDLKARYRWWSREGWLMTLNPFNPSAVDYDYASDRYPNVTLNPGTIPDNWTVTGAPPTEPRYWAEDVAVYTEYFRARHKGGTIRRWPTRTEWDTQQLADVLHSFP